VPRSTSIETAEEEPLRILIVAEHASARFGGEAALPLHYFRVLRRRGNPVWLVTHARTRAELDALCPGDPRIHYIEDTGFHRLMWRLSRLLPSRIAYFTTGFASRFAVQLVQRRVIRRLVAEHAISVVHQPMPVSPREPSMIYGFGVPVIIGPMNGGMDYPPAFRHQRSFEGFFVQMARAGSRLLNWAMPGKRQAQVLLVANERTRRALPTGSRGAVVELVENGVDLALWEPSAKCESEPRADPAIASFVYMGRLVDWKRVDLLMRAFALSSAQVRMRLAVIGSGAEEPALRDLARELNVWAPDDTSPGVAFAGWLSQAQCAERLRDSDCLVLPSILECGGAVVLEAMAMGKPVIATAWGGPLDYLDASCGILVPPSSVDALVEGLAAAMVRLAASPQERAELGRAGRAKVLREYDWDVKVAHILEIYAEAMRRSDRGSSDTRRNVRR
jgi:glycosyltransferase involved in cell wall biosynthesis